MGPKDDVGVQVLDNASSVDVKGVHLRVIPLLDHNLLHILHVLCPFWDLLVPDEQSFIVLFVLLRAVRQLHRLEPRPLVTSKRLQRT